MQFACDGTCSAQISAEPIYCPAVINPYTLRPVIGLHGDQMDEVLLYRGEEDAKIATLHTKARLSKRDPLCEILQTNTLVHPSQHMLLFRRILYLSWLSPPPRRKHYLLGAYGTSGPLSSLSTFTTYNAFVNCFQVRKGITTVARKVKLLLQTLCQAPSVSNECRCGLAVYYDLFFL